MTHVHEEVVIDPVQTFLGELAVLGTKITDQLTTIATEHGQEIVDLGLSVIQLMSFMTVFSGIFISIFVSFIGVMVCRVLFYFITEDELLPSIVRGSINGPFWIFAGGFSIISLFNNFWAVVGIFNPILRLAGEAIGKLF